MIHLYQLADTNFLLFDASRTVYETIETTRTVKPTGIIVQSWHADRMDYYLYAANKFFTTLAEAADGHALSDALDLSNQMAIPQGQSYDDAELAPSRCVIMQGTRVFGFYDATIPVSMGGNPRSGLDYTTSDNTTNARTLQAEFPEQVGLGETATLCVALTRKASSADSTPITAAVGTELKIFVDTVTGLEIVGAPTGTLLVTEADTSAQLEFKLRATALGQTRIHVYCLQAGLSLGSITLAPTVIATQAPADTELTQASTNTNPHLGPLAFPSADLSLLIFERTLGATTTLEFHLSAEDINLGLNLKPFGTRELRMNPSSYFQDLFQDITNMPLSTPADEKLALARLGYKGVNLFKDILPEEVRTQLWFLRDRIRTIHVESQEPWIPWELLKLYGKNPDGRIVEGPFLCEAFDMTRWILGTPRRPTLSMKNLAVIAPQNAYLNQATSEKAYLTGLANTQRQVTLIPAIRENVTDALTRGEHDGWHFVGHGTFQPANPALSAIYLEDQPLQVTEFGGTMENCGRTHPLVFLNACETGRAGWSLTGISGWAQRFVESEAAVFVGSLWSVHDGPANTFAQAFYETLLNSADAPTVGQSIRAARKAIAASPDRLAYTVFADPFARVG